MTNQNEHTQPKAGDKSAEVKRILSIPNVKTYVEDLAKNGISVEVIPIQRKTLADIQSTTK